MVQLQQCLLRALPILIRRYVLRLQVARALHKEGLLAELLSPMHGQQPETLSARVPRRDDAAETPDADGEDLCEHADR